MQIAAGNLQTDQSHLERYFENSYKIYEYLKHVQIKNGRAFETLPLGYKLSLI